MKPNVIDWTIVIPGAWNLAILNPNWLAQNIFRVGQIEVEGLFGPYATQLRFNHGLVSLNPQAERLVIGARAPSEAAMNEVEEIALRVAATLPVTPVNGVGVNFGFIETEPSPDLARLFDFRDNGGVADTGYTIGESTISRTLESEIATLNLNVRKDAAQIMYFHLNFHQQADSLAVVRDRLEGRVAAYLQNSYSILESVYDLREEGKDQ